MRKAVVVASALAAMLTTLALASDCSRGPSTSRAPIAPSPSSSSTPGLQSLVHSYALKIAAEARTAPCQTSSNPWDYVTYCPTIKRLVALGAPALPFIAMEIKTRAAAGLDGYMLAIAGDRIWGPHGVPTAPGAMSWESGQTWAAQYLTWAKDHPSAD